MTKASRVFVAAVIAGAALIGASGVAQATDPTPAPTRPNTAPTPAPTKPSAGDGSPPVSITADGNFYVMSDDYFNEYGVYVNTGNSKAWPWWVFNKNDWVWNNGYVGGRDHVNIYWKRDWQGAYACIGPGTSWDLRGDSYRFTWTRFGMDDGLWESVHDNATSHRWVDYCGNDTW